MFVWLVLFQFVVARGDVEYVPVATTTSAQQAALHIAICAMGPMAPEIARSENAATVVH